MDKFFINLYYLIAKRRKLFLLFVLLFFGTTVFIASRIQFDEDITKILPKGEGNDKVAKILNQLNFSDKISIMIKAKNDENKEKLADIALEFIDSLQVDSLYFTEIQGQVGEDQMEETFSFVYEHLPLFLEDEDYQTIEERITPEALQERMQDNYNTLISPTGMVVRDYILKDPLGISFIGLNTLRELGVSQDFILHNGFIHSADTSTLLLFLTPSFSGTDSKNNEPFVEHLYQLQAEFNKNYVEIAETTYFGAPFIALANAEQIKSDIKSTVVISIIVLMLILILFYRKLYIPIILFVPALLGAGFALSVLYFLHPSISAISISVGAILLGVTLDYSIHVVTHFREHSDIETMYQSITKPLLGCSFTTSIAFLCLLFVQSEVLQDLGVFAAISILAAALFALIVIPHIYRPAPAIKANLIDKIGAHSFERNYILIGVTTLAIIFGIFTFTKVYFNNNISDLNFVPENMKASEKQLEEIGSMSSKSLYVTIYGVEVEELLQTNNLLEAQLAALKNDQKVEDYNSIGKVVLSKEVQAKKLKTWKEFWQKHDATKVMNNLNAAAIELGFNDGAFSQFEEVLTNDFEEISLEEYQDFTTIPLKEFLIEKNGFITLSTMVKVSEDQYEEVAKAMEGKNVIVIDRKHLNEQFLGQMKDDFRMLMNYSLIVVLALLLFFFKRIELAILAIIPIVLTGIVTMGLTYLLGLELNIFSTIVTTLILGIGVDFSIFMTSGLQKRFTTGKNELNTYRVSIILAVLTTVLSIGVLIFAKHPALKSISWISLIGILSAMLITFAFYPILFKLFISSRSNKGKAPVNLRLFVSAVLSHTYFALGSLLHSLFGLLLFLIPIPKAKKQRFLRRAIAKFVKSVYYSNYGVKNYFKNPHGETFEKPAIIIANHASFLDTLSIGFLPTDFTFLVNDWVYNSPIFGKAVRAAGYYPVTAGLENGEEKLAEMIKNGTSIVVFPEGTRSYTGALSRFKKGAYLLAQKYHIDIVPLYIHGNSNILPKGDFIIFDGNHTLEIGKRIVFDGKHDNLSVRDLTKSLSQEYKDEFFAIRDREEDVDYFKQKVDLNFLYKMDDVKEQAKAEYAENRLVYYEVNSLLGEKETIFRVGNDLGIWDMMLSLHRADRKITSFINEEENRAIARENYTSKDKHRKINYIDEIEKVNASTLLITTGVSDLLLSSILEKNNFEKIIVTANSKINPSFFHTFEYQTIDNNANSTLLTRKNE